MTEGEAYEALAALLREVDGYVTTRESARRLIPITFEALATRLPSTSDA